MSPIIYSKRTSSKMTRAKIPVDLTKNDIVQMFHKNKTILSLNYLGIGIDR